MGGGQYIGLERSVAAQGEPGAENAGVCSPRAEIGAPGAFERGQLFPRPYALALCAAQGYPSLRRGMVITVERPWQWTRPLLSALAWGIRRESTRISGHPARASHAMLYVGGGRVASQDTHYEIVRLEDYEGCILRFWDPPRADQQQRNALVAEAVVHVGQDYGYRDVLAQAMRAATGNPAWLAALGDPRKPDCSEAVCQLMRATVDLDFGGRERTCDLTPQELEDWMIAQGWRCLALRLV